MNQGINRWIFEIPLEDIQSDFFEESHISANPCICCGKEIKSTKWEVHLLNNGNLVSSQEDFEESQGFYPIGSRCKSKLPNNFYWKVESN